jgi:hypothetical protein
MNSINSAGLLDPQVPHVTTLVDSLYINGYAVDMSSTGTGKMYCAAATARELNVPICVVCPKSVIPQWEKVIKLFNINPKALINFEKLARGKTKWMKWMKKQPDPSSKKPDATCEMPVFNFPQNALIIVDEAHKCKGINTSTSWLLVGLKTQNYRVLLSSATLACTPLEMKSSGYVTGLHKLYDFADFCRVHGAQWMGHHGAMSFSMDSKEAEVAMKALHEYLFTTVKCASRMVPEMFGKVFPKSHIVAESFNLGANQKKLESVYAEMESELAKLDNDSKKYKDHIFSILMKARRLAELCKVPVFVDKVEDFFDEGQSVVVFVNFADTVSGIKSRLLKSKKIKESDIGYVIGGQSPKERAADVDGFNADTKRILIVNIAAGGTGISLHDLHGKFPRSTIISPCWSAYSMKQAFGRVHRLEGKTPSYQLVVYGANTVEEQICRRVQFKLKNLDTLNDSDLIETNHLTLIEV